MKHVIVVAVLLALPLIASTDLRGQVPFRIHSINPQSEFSACAAIDVNRDGRLDIVSGEYWYEAPEWTAQRFRQIENIRGRYDDYANLPLDVDRDGFIDLVSVNYRSQSIYWDRNPGQPGQMWDRRRVDAPGPSETGRLFDLDGDGRLDVLPAGTSFAAWYQVVDDPAAADGVTWVKHALPPAVAGHGIGVGDINGDGRLDVIACGGWAESPENPARDAWIWHPEFRLHPDASIPILVVDVDRDGDQDLVWGRGHHVGLYWMEQRHDGSDRSWILHAIDTSWSSPHSLLWADIDGDGNDDLIAGKRYLGHDGRDPGETEPLGVYWYRFEPSRKTWSRFTIAWGGHCGMDLDPKAVDLDADGDIDLIAPSRGGLSWLENLRIDGDDRHSESESTVEQAADTPHAMPPSPGPRPLLDDTDPRNLLVVRGDDGAQRPVENALDWGVRRAHLVARMEQVMGPLPGASRRVPLDMTVERVEETEDYWRKKIWYQAEPGDRVPAFLLIPKNLKAPVPAVLCLHPTHPLGKAQICGLGGQPSRFYAHELAKRGYVVLAPDYPSFGDYKYNFDRDGAHYASGSMKAIWNNIRALDLLESLPEVQYRPIGCVGHSLGGHNALFTAVFDHRIRAVVTSCGFTAFARYYEGDLTGWTSDRYMPRIRDLYAKDPRRMPFDFHEVLAALAPRAVLVSAPLADDNFDNAGVRECVEAARKVGALLGNENSLTAVYPDAAHDFPEEIRQMAYAWLDDALGR